MSLAAYTMLDTVSKFNDFKSRWIGVLLDTQQGRYWRLFLDLIYLLFLLSHADLSLVSGGL